VSGVYTYALGPASSDVIDAEAFVRIDADVYVRAASDVDDADGWEWRFRGGGMRGRRGGCGPACVKRRGADTVLAWLVRMVGVWWAW
jgi:hypothetical protein